MTHIPEDTLDSYAVGKLDGPSLAAVEEHLLVCHECQDRLAALDRLIATLRGGAGASACHSN